MSEVAAVNGDEVTTAQIEAAIARCGKAHPNESQKLHPETSALCEVYGEMIWRKAPHITLSDLPENIQAVVRRWVVA